MKPTTRARQQGGRQYVAFSGGKDSTALVLRMAEMGEDFACLFTPTGNEPSDCIDHIHRIVDKVDVDLIQPPNLSLEHWIEEFNALPNNRQRWCTRLIKIAPCIKFLSEHPGSVLCVGLRADEEEREGLYGPYATYRYPLREWGWKLPDVLTYVKSQNIDVPERTDCMWCYDQRLIEWYRLWRDRPAEFAAGEAIEAKRDGHTFRSPSRDTWPASMAGLRGEFERGRVPKERKLRVLNNEEGRCRVCSM